MIKAIFFDAAGILYTRAGPTEQYALTLLENHGFVTGLSQDQMDHQLALKSQANRSQINHEMYWDEFLSMRGVLDLQQRRDFTEAIIKYSNDIQPMPGGREALAGLKARGLRLGIITDTMYPMEWKMRRLEKAGVAEFIDIVACSTDLGVHKPDPAIYSYALQQAQLAPGEAVFVGHLDVELHGAHQAGMITIAINPDPGANADYYCDTLLDLLTLKILQDSLIQPLR